MSQLQILLNEHAAQLAADKAKMEQDELTYRTGVIAKSHERLATVIARWNLRELMGEPHCTSTTERVNATWEIEVDGVGLTITAATPIAAAGTVEFKFIDGERQLALNLPPVMTLQEFTTAFLREMTPFLDRREQELATLQERAERYQRRLATAQQLTALARLYTERQAIYRRWTMQWAERWTHELWQPWSMWRVRYVPVSNSPVEDEGGPETIMCLEGPDEIVTALRQFPTVTVHRVQTDGTIVEMEIPSFLDAERCILDEPSTEEALPYHRRYRAVGAIVNVPAVDEREPEPAHWLGSFADYVRNADTPWTNALAGANQEWLFEVLQTWTPERLAEEQGFLFD